MLLVFVETTLLTPLKLAARALKADEVCVATLEPVPAAVEISLIFSVRVAVCAIVDAWVETTLLKAVKLAVSVLMLVLFIATTGISVETAEERFSIAARAPL